MIEIENSLNLILLINSISIIILILNQNDISKDLTTTVKSSSFLNPLEKITWASLTLQCCLFFLQIKAKYI